MNIMILSKMVKQAGAERAKLSLALAIYQLLWTSCEYDRDMSWKRMNKAWKSYEQGMNKVGTSHEQVMNKS